MTAYTNLGIKAVLDSQTLPTVITITMVVTKVFVERDAIHFFATRTHTMPQMPHMHGLLMIQLLAWATNLPVTVTTTVHVNATTAMHAMIATHTSNDVHGTGSHFVG